MGDSPISSEQNDASLQLDVPSKKKSKQKQGTLDEPSKCKGLPDSSVNLKTIQNLFSCACLPLQAFCPFGLRVIPNLYKAKVSKLHSQGESYFKPWTHFSS